MCPGVDGSGIHGATIGTSLGVDAVAREVCTSSDKHALGVNEGRRPSSAAVIKETGGDGSEGHDAFLGGGKKPISSFDQSVSDAG